MLGSMSGLVMEFVEFWRKHIDFQSDLGSLLQYHDMGCLGIFPN